MAANKNALIRYKVIDRCLRNKQRKYTIEDLIEACSDALYEYEGKDVNIGKRTIQLDLQNMRSSKLGYDAPIEVYEKKYYRYADAGFSIHNIPVNEHDLQTMNNAIQILKQFKDFNIFNEMNGVIQKLENSIHSFQDKSIIHLDKNERLKGLEFIDKLYDAVLNKTALEVTYKSFKAHQSKVHVIHPQFLKEFNNRWFIFAWTKNKIINLALDRIESIVALPQVPYVDKDINPDEYFKDIVGVTVNEGERPEKIKFFVDKKNAPYVMTKPLHQSQELIEILENGAVFSIKVQINNELERLLLGFGETLTVLSPKSLKENMMKKFKKALEHYDDKK